MQNQQQSNTGRGQFNRSGQNYRGGSSGDFNYQNGPNSFQGFNDGFLTPLDNLIEATEYKLNSLYQARQGYINAEQMEQSVAGWNQNQGGGGNFSSSNRGYQNQGGGGGGSFSSGRTGGPNFSGGSNDSTDGRTMAGRMAHDADDVDPNELIGYLESAPRNQDESIDLRTAEGRALKAAGWVDEEGFEIQEAVSQFSRQGQQGSSRSGGRTYSGRQSNSRSSSSR
jgi:hypothetical protein